MHKYALLTVLVLFAMLLWPLVASAAEPYGLHVKSGPSHYGTDVLVLSYPGGNGDFNVTVYGLHPDMGPWEKAYAIASAINADSHPVAAAVLEGPDGYPFVSIRFDPAEDGWSADDPYCTGMNWRNGSGEATDEIYASSGWDGDPAKTEDDDEDSGEDHDEGSYRISGSVTGLTAEGEPASLTFGIDDLTIEVDTAYFSSVEDILMYMLDELQAAGISAWLEEDDETILCDLVAGTYEVVRLGTTDYGLQSTLGLRDD